MKTFLTACFFLTVLISCKYETKNEEEKEELTIVDSKDILKRIDETLSKDTTYDNEMDGVVLVGYAKRLNENIMVKN